MAAELITLKNAAGTTLNPRTSIPAVSGLEDALEGKASKDFVNSAVQTMSAAAIAYDVDGNPFPTKADLNNAETFYHGGEEKEPDEHDYATVLEDEEHGGAQTRYTFSGGAWTFQFLVNDTPFTKAQNDAINSGITSDKITELEGRGTIRFVSHGADLSEFGENDLIIEFDPELVE